MHGGLFLTAPKIPFLLERILKWVFSWDVPFIVLSDGEKEILEKRFGAKRVEVLPNCPDAPKGLAPVGRLDKDTTGLLLITNDGKLAHELLSPKKHVDKTYFVTLDGQLSAEDIAALEAGVRIGEGDLTAPATVKSEGGNTCYITIHEGKFHQVQRMFFAVGREVLELKRTSFGQLNLDEEDLPIGHINKLKCESFY